MNEKHQNWEILIADNKWDDAVESICFFKGTHEDAFRYAHALAPAYIRDHIDPEREIEHVAFYSPEESANSEAFCIQRPNSHLSCFVRRYEKPELRTIDDLEAEDFLFLKDYASLGLMEEEDIGRYMEEWSATPPAQEKGGRI